MNNKNNNQQERAVLPAALSLIFPIFANGYLVYKCLFIEMQKRQLLKTVSGLKGKNISRFNPHFATHLVVDNITDFSPLRKLKAYQMFERDLKTVLIIS